MQGFRTGYIPQRIGSGRVCLALPGPLELYRISSRFGKLEAPVLGNLGLKRAPGLFSALFILVRLFRWVYVIRKDGQAVGILGAYSWQPGRNAHLAMLIWDRDERGRGTGSRALALAVSKLREHGLCTEFFSEVRRENPRGLRFWQKNGFNIIGSRDDILVLARKQK